MSTAKISTLRSLIRELKAGLPVGQNVKQLSSFQFIIDQYKKNKLTSEQYCREKEEMAYIANTYNTYLQSNRK